MKRAHANRLVVKRGALPPDFTPINDYQKHIKLEITKGGLPDWNPEVVALGRVIEREPFIRMYVEQMLQEVPDGYRHFESVEKPEGGQFRRPYRADLQGRQLDHPWQFPLSALMNFWMMTPSGKAVLRMPQMNDHINKIMKAGASSWTARTAATC